MLKIIWIICTPLIVCQVNSPKIEKFSTIWVILAQFDPFCIRGDKDAEAAIKAVMPSPASRCGPTNNLPLLIYVIAIPPIEPETIINKIREPIW